MKIFEVANPRDVVAMDVPFLIRALEYAREDAKDDMDLHDAVERMINAAQKGEPLDMNDYDLVFGASHDVAEGDITQLEKDIADAPVKPIANMEADEKIAGRHDPAEFDAMVDRLKKLAGSGPMKTVYDPTTRRYKNVPVAQQPK